MRERDLQQKPGSQGVAPVIAGLSGAVLAAAAGWKFGPGMTPDSVNYLAASESFLGGQGFLSCDASPFTLWPPAMPVLIALFKVLVPADPLRALLVFNGLCYTGTILVAGRVTFLMTRNRNAAGLCALLVLFSVPLFFVAGMAWSEPLFCLLVMAFFMAGLEEGLPPMKRAALMAAVSGFACLTRYAGVVLIPVGVLFLALQGSSWRERLKQMAVFCFLCAVLFSPWLVRNFAVSGHLTGPRYPSSLSFERNLTLAASTIHKWFLPGRVPGPVKALSVLLLFGWTGGSVLFSFKEKGREGIRAAGFARGGFLCVLFVFLYLFWLVVSASLVAFDPLRDRLLSPIYGPLVCLLSCLPFLTPPGSRTGRARTRRLIFFSLLFSSLIIHSAKVISKETEKRLTRGPGGFTVRKWMDSPTAAYLKALSPREKIFSNHPPAVFLFAGLRAGEAAFRHPYNSPEGPGNLESFLEECDGGILVWFHDSPPRYFKPSELEQFLRLDPVAVFDDGAVYRMKRKRSPSD